MSATARSTPTSPASTLIRKAVMALTGLFVCVFLVVHLAGNLLLLLPPEEAQPLFNTYAELLSTNPLISVISWALFAALAAHVGVAAWISVLNRRAAGARGALERRAQASPWHRRQMGALGVVLLVFLVVHLKDLWFAYSFGAVPTDPGGRRDLYTVVIAAFSARWYVALHVGAFAALGLHLLHGGVGAAQTLGLHHPRARRIARLAGILFSATITVGFCAIAVGVHLLHGPGV